MLDDRTRIWAVGISNKLNLCGCGSGNEWGVVCAVLRRARDRQSFYDEMAGVPAAWVEFAAKVLDGAGMLEHGTSIGFAWLTPDGEALLEFLEASGGEWVDCQDLYLDADEIRSADSKGGAE